MNLKAKNISFVIFLALNLILSLNLTSCNSTEPKLEPELALKLEEVSCTEAWLQLTSNNIQIPNNISLLVDGNVKKTFTLNTQDSLLYIDSLLPNQSYKFKIVLNTTNNPQPTTNEVIAQTMDTTSHNFTWQSFEFGQHSSSVLYDVTIIDENNIWAVGEIYMNDSLGNPDPNAYNALHWNGQSWELKRINMQSSCNPIPYPPLRAIWTFSENNIVITSGGSIGWFDGTTNRTDCAIRSLITGSINKMWGSSSSDLYVVGSNGNIAHYTNGSWTKIESGSDVRLNDIYGQVNGSKIFTSGYNTFGYQKSSLLQLENNQATIIWNSENNIEIPPYGKQINSISVTFNNLFIASDQGIFKKNIVHNYITPIRLFGSGMKVHKILATGINNIFTVGDQSNIYHYNGLTAHQVYYDYSASNSLYSGTAKESILVGVGTKVSNAVYHKAIIVIGQIQ